METFLYISRWDEFTGSPGIALLTLNLESGKISTAEDIEKTLTCNCTCVDETRGILYITNEVKDHPDFVKGGGGLIYAFQIAPDTGRLTQLSRVATCCPCPAYISIDPTGQYLVCANHSSYSAVTKAVKRQDGTWGMDIIYDDATVDLFELNHDGSIGRLVDVAKHTGVKNSSLLHSHPHSAVWAPSGRFFACCDKGDDLIYMYRIDYSSGKLILLGEPNRDEPDSMPRYCAFHPRKPFFFVNHERNVYVSSFLYDQDGRLKKIGSAASVPSNIKLPQMSSFLPGQKPAQQVMTISADGRHIYNVVNGQGIDGVSVFEINQEHGTLNLLQYLKVDGEWARGAAFSPDGRFLVVTCLAGKGAVISFRVEDDGTLTPTGSQVSIPGAAYATFFPKV